MMNSTPTFPKITQEMVDAHVAKVGGCNEMRTRLSEFVGEPADPNHILDFLLRRMSVGWDSEQATPKWTLFGRSNLASLDHLIWALLREANLVGASYKMSSVRDAIGEALKTLTSAKPEPKLKGFTEDDGRRAEGYIRVTLDDTAVDGQVGIKLWGPEGHLGYLGDLYVHDGKVCFAVHKQSLPSPYSKTEGKIMVYVDGKAVA